jgi:hypothetical protein
MQPGVLLPFRLLFLIEVLRLGLFFIAFLIMPRLFVGLCYFSGNCILFYLFIPHRLIFFFYIFLYFSIILFLLFFVYYFYF